MNITNPAAPFEAGFYDTPGSALGVAVAGSYAYVADGYDGLRIVNITNPAAPFEAGFYDTPGAACDVAVAGNYAYVADHEGGLRIVNITNPATPTLAGFYFMPGEAVDVAVAGDYAYVADAWSGLWIINITNPAAPTLAGFYDTPGYASGVAVAGNYTYVADGSYFGIYDCSDAIQTVDHSLVELPQTVTLYPCYPNPFNPMTTISFDLPVAVQVLLTVYNVNGQAVETLVNEQRPAGTFNVSFDGARLSSGTYFYTLNAGAVRETRKMVLVK